MELIKSSDLYIKAGTLCTFLFGGLSMTVVNQIAQLVLILVSIVVGITTFIYTQEKRRHLKRISNHKPK